MTSLVAALGGCTGVSSTAETAAAPPPPLTQPTTPAPQAAPVSSGITTADDVTGSGCGQLPTEGPGSAKGMALDPVATAAGHNPLLTTFVTALRAANLVDMLDSAEGLTVFAPINPAFEALPPGTVDQLTKSPEAAKPTGRLTEILASHVIGRRMTARDLLRAGTVDSLQGSTLTIRGSAPDDLTVASGGVTARVVCANIPTVNATVFLVDRVVMPGAG